VVGDTLSTLLAWFVDGHPRWTPCATSTRQTCFAAGWATCVLWRATTLGTVLAEPLTRLHQNPTNCSEYNLPCVIQIRYPGAEAAAAWLVC